METRIDGTRGHRREQQVPKRTVIDEYVQTEKEPRLTARGGTLAQVVVRGLLPPWTALPAKSEFAYEPATEKVAMNQATRGVRQAKAGTRETGSGQRINSVPHARMAVFRTARLIGSTIAGAALFIKWTGTGAASNHEQRVRSIEGHAGAELAAAHSIRIAADRHGRRPRTPVAVPSLTDAPTRGPDPRNSAGPSAPACVA